MAGLRDLPCLRPVTTSESHASQPLEPQDDARSSSSGQPRRSLRGKLRVFLLKEWPHKSPPASPPSSASSTSQDDRPAVMRMKDSDDYITARAANPWTGRISPSVATLTPSHTPESPADALPRYLYYTQSRSPSPDVPLRPALRNPASLALVQPSSPGKAVWNTYVDRASTSDSSSTHSSDAFSDPNEQISPTTARDISPLFKLLTILLLGLFNLCKTVALPSLPRLQVLDALSSDTATPEQKVDAMKTIVSSTGQLLVVFMILGTLWSVGSAVGRVLEVVFWPVSVPLRMLRWLGG